MPTFPGLLDLFDQLRAAGPRRACRCRPIPACVREAAAERFRAVIADPISACIVAERMRRSGGHGAVLHRDVQHAGDSAGGRALAPDRRSELTSGGGRPGAGRSGYPMGRRVRHRPTPGRRLRLIARSEPVLRPPGFRAGFGQPGRARCRGCAASSAPRCLPPRPIARPEPAVGGCGWGSPAAGRRPPCGAAFPASGRAARPERRLAHGLAAQNPAVLEVLA